jgi:hypothetical protein
VERRDDMEKSVLAKIREALRADAFRPLDRPLLLITIATALIAFDVAARLVPHESLGIPIVASGLIAGFLMRSRLAAFAVPLIALAVSDVFLGMYEWQTMIAVYLCLAVPALFGGLGRTKYAPLALGALALGSSLLFYIVVNFAVWRFGHLYPQTPTGLMTSYVAGLPFFRSAVESDVGWTLGLFVIFAIVRALGTPHSTTTLTRAAA